MNEHEARARRVCSAVGLDYLGSTGDLVAYAVPGNIKERWSMPWCAIEAIAKLLDTRRFEAAKTAMQGMAANYSIYTTWVKLQKRAGKPFDNIAFSHALIDSACKCADHLLAALDRKGADNA